MREACYMWTVSIPWMNIELQLSNVIAFIIHGSTKDEIQNNIIRHK